jgi:hypothetical protein
MTGRAAYGEPDGFGRYGVLDLDAAGNPVCHECGQPFPFLGRHVRRHGIDPDRYRERHGLGQGTPLASQQIRSEMREVGKAKTEAEWWPRFRESSEAAKLGSLRAARAVLAEDTRPEERRRKQEGAPRWMRAANLARRNPAVHTCVVCGAQWCRVGGSRPPKVCSDLCRIRQLGWDPRAARTTLVRPDRVDWTVSIPEIRAQWVEPAEIAEVKGLSRAFVYRVLRQERVG